jgi:hypothetical protein
MKWISVKDKLPQNDLICLICHEAYPIKYVIALYMHRYNEFKEIDWAKTFDFPLAPTHWCPIPSMPVKVDSKSKD